MSASRIPLVVPEELKHSWRDRAQRVDAAHWKRRCEML